MTHLIDHSQAKVITAMWLPAIQANLPAGYTCSRFQNGMGTFGISYYCYIYNAAGAQILTIRISDHFSNATITSGYICCTWGNIASVIADLQLAFAPKKEVEVELCGEYTDEYSILKMHPDATNIRKGEFVRISKKGKREIFMYYFTKRKIVIA